MREGLGRVNRNHNANHALAEIYLGPAVMQHFAINWLWGDETKATGNDDAGNNG